MRKGNLIQHSCLKGEKEERTCLLDFLQAVFPQLIGASSVLLCPLQMFLGVPVAHHHYALALLLVLKDRRGKQTGSTTQLATF